MKSRHGIALSAIAVWVASTVPQSAVAGPADEVEALKQSLVQQQAQLEQYQRELAEQKLKMDELRKAVATSQRQLDSVLASTRGAGTAAGASVSSQPAAIELAQAEQASPPGQVGQRPEQDRPKEVAQIFEQPGVLTPPGKMVLEPGLQFAYSSSSQVALSGYTIIPALLIGVLDIREVKRETWTASLTGRLGITNRFEMEMRVPYVYRRDSTLARPIATGSSTDFLYETSTSRLGDVELTGRYQFNDGGADKPYYIGSLKFKSRTGLDPFETDKFVVPLSGGQQLDAQLPTGSGFYSLTPGLTFLLPSDPVVLFGGVSYTYNFKRANVTTHTATGVQAIGDVKAGNVLGFNIGMGLALNEKSSISLGYDHSVVGKTKINSENAAKSQRVHLGTFLVGYSHRLAPDKTLNVSLGIGTTRDAPDMQLSLRVPVTF